MIFIKMLAAISGFKDISVEGIININLVKI